MSVVTTEVAKKAIKKAAEDSDDLNKQHLARIRSVQRRIEMIERKLADAKEEVAAFKSDLKLANKELREEIADGTGRLPFKDSDQAAGRAGISDGTESWRSVSLEELKLPARALEKLNAADLHTLGDVADYSAAVSSLTEIEGVGPAMAEKIEKALERWWVKNPLAKVSGSLQVETRS